MKIDKIKQEISSLNQELECQKFSKLINNYFNCFDKIDLDEIQNLDTVFKKLNNSKMYFSLKHDGLNELKSIILIKNQKKPKTNYTFFLIKQKISKLIPTNEKESAFFESIKNLSDSFCYMDNEDINTLNDLFNEIYNEEIILNQYNFYGKDGNNIEFVIDKKSKNK